MNGLIVYKSKYGATQQYAGWAGEDLGLDVYTTENLYSGRLEQADFVVMGSSVYIGKMLISDWLRKNQGVLQNKKLILFVVCATPASEGQKRGEIIHASVPVSLLDRLDIFFLPGRLAIKQLSWRDRLLLRMGRMLEKDPQKKKAMGQDIDEVKRENLEELIKAVGKYTPGSAVHAQPEGAAHIY